MPEQALDTLIAAIGQAATRIAQRQGADDELQHLRTYLVGLLEVMDRDPGVDAAADDLYAAARAFVTAHRGAHVGRDPRHVRLLGEAFQRFQDRVKFRAAR